MSTEAPTITPDLLLHAYASGVFPMAESRDDPDIFWVEPNERGILPLDRFHLSKSLRKTVRSDKFSVSIDRNFRDVMVACAKAAPDRESTWISHRIEDLYSELHQLGFAHSIECWLDNKLVGGLYGIALKSAFFGESMFHQETDASKVALAHLVARLKLSDFSLLDIQFQTEHLKQFGTREVPSYEYQDILAAAMQKEADFEAAGTSMSGADVCIQLDSETSTR